MKHRKVMGLFAGSLLVIGMGSAFGQSGGRPEELRSGACFYEHPNFGGKHFCVAVGDAKGMVPEGMNDRISSIRVFGGAEVTVFKDRDYRGDSRRIGHDVSDLREIGFNDRISSFRVGERHDREERGLSWGRPEVLPSGACFYENPNFEGRYFCAAAGDATEMVPEGMNDKVSSIRLFGDAQVTVYKDRDFRGDSRHFGHDMSDLRGAGFNDRISSFRITAHGSFHHH